MHGVVLINILVCIMQSGRKLPFDIMPTKRAFYSACNSIIAHSNSLMNFRSLQEKYSLYVDAHVQDAPIKSTPLQSIANNLSTV